MCITLGTSWGSSAVLGSREYLFSSKSDPDDVFVCMESHQQTDGCILIQANHSSLSLGCQTGPDFNAVD